MMISGFAPAEPAVGNSQCVANCAKQKSSGGLRSSYGFDFVAGIFADVDDAVVENQVLAFDAE